MPLSHGRNRRTRKLFKRPFRGHGLQNTTTFLRTYKVGDYVTILCNASVQHGLPFRAFHGKVGRVWNVNQRAIGVMINKKVNNRILVKRFHVRPEHLKPSNCQKDFLERKAETKRIQLENMKLKKEGKELLPFPEKRMPKQPRRAETIKGADIKFTTVAPLRYEELY
ncbi:Large ribosomal subunit protein eL21 [Entamoeba marina]